MRRGQILSIAMLFTAGAVAAQGDAPRNNWAADSPWPQFHHDGHASASSPLRGPEPGDRIGVQSVTLETGFGATPTQMHLSERYPDGARAAWSTTLSSIVKARIAGDSFEPVDILRLRSGLRLSAFWNMQLARGNKAFVPDPVNRRLLRIGDADPRNSRSKLRIEAIYALPLDITGDPIVLNLSYDGRIIFLTDGGWLGAVTQDFADPHWLNLKAALKDDTIHNSFPLDENGVAYLVSFNALTAVQWTGRDFHLLWQAPYDFRGPGCGSPSKSKLREVLRVFRGERCTGSGTTPTLVDAGSDRLVAVVDGHDQNNLIYFWRDAIPRDWRGLPGRDRRIAAIVRLPYATNRGEGFTTENSPASAGDMLVVAQFAGFRPDCSPPMGVQAIRWDPAAHSAGVAWARGDIHFNGIPTISTASRLVYGTGRSGTGCRYAYRGLDLATGATKIDVDLGASDVVLDQGNSHALNDDRSIIYGGTRGMVRIRPVASAPTSAKN